MSSRDITVAERVGDWLQAYNAVRAELTPEPVRVLIQQVTADDPAAVHLGIDMARIVFANDRAAGEIAAELVKFGIEHRREDI